MHPSKPIFKVISLASSILLVGGYVAYRANAFHGLTGSLPDDSPTEHSANHVTLGGGESAGAIEWNPVIMSGSKSGIIISDDVLKPGSTSNSLNDPALVNSGRTPGGALLTPTVTLMDRSQAMMSSSKSVLLSAAPQQTQPSKSAQVKRPRANQSADAKQVPANGPAKEKSQSASRSR